MSLICSSSQSKSSSKSVVSGPETASASSRPCRDLRRRQGSDTALRSAPAHIRHPANTVKWLNGIVIRSSESSRLIRLWNESVITPRKKILGVILAVSDFLCSIAVVVLLIIALIFFHINYGTKQNCRSKLASNPLSLTHENRKTNWRTGKESR